MGLVPLLSGDDVLWAREPGVVGEADGGLDILELKLSSFGSVSFLIRDGSNITGRKPSTLLTEQTIPPS